VTQPGVRCRREDGIVWLTINRPERKNALDTQAWRSLLGHLRDTGERRADRVVILTGAGADFSAGADLKEPPDAEAPRHPLDVVGLINDVALTLHRLPQPTIAKVRGVAVGGGCCLAAACDLVVAADSARFGLDFGRTGLSVDVGGSWTVPRRVGLTRAKELLLVGRTIDAGEARDIGLISRLVSDEALDDEVAAMARDLASKAPIALRQTKRLLNNSMTSTLEQALDDEAAAQAVNMRTKDFREALAAFAERRAPLFSGR
jgi:2-(1,2-epoxy-1,2-dihydrophenyl)acetyl-CoA isomerase